MARHVRKVQPVEETVDVLARQRISNAFDRFDHIAVSFSGGKDSTVCLMLTLEEARRRGRLPLHVVHFDEEAIPYQTADYVRRLTANPELRVAWYCLPVKHRNACSRQQPWWSPWAPEDKALWVRPLPPEGIWRMPGYDLPPMEARLSIPDLIGTIFDAATYGTVGMVMGIRAQESVTRQRAVSWRSAAEENYIVHDVGATTQGNLWKVYPIYDWRTTDVWTAPKLYGWDYNRAYDVLEAAGLPQNMQRCSPAFGEEPLQKLWTYQTCFPELWDKMSDRVPGVNTAIRYATTELYGYGGIVEKHPEMSYEQAIRHYLAKFDPVSRKKIAKRIRIELQWHYLKTEEPIVGDTPHPLTGLNWKFLLMIAQRGDFKHRRFPEKQVDKYPDRDALRALYEAERTKMFGPARPERLARAPLPAAAPLGEPQELSQEVAQELSQEMPA